MIRKIIIALLALLMLCQFFQIDKTAPAVQASDIANHYQVPEDVQRILKKACYDCHSNETIYPWYSSVQPLGWWLKHHIDEGKEHLNFSEFAGRRIAVQNHKFEEIIETVKEGEMPLKSYTWLGMHPEAKLSLEERTRITSWAQMQMDLIAQQYPADSLVLKRR